MKVLFVDTTTTDLVVAVVEDNEIKDFTLRDCAMRHSVVLCDCVQKALDSCHLTFGDLDAYACAIGPGSFTGIRIGIATLKGYAMAVPKPLIAVNCLEAVAKSPLCGNRLSAVINAGNGYYFADYSNGTVPCLISYDDERAPNAGRCNSAADCLDGAAAIVRDRFGKKQFDSELVPMYIRRSQAEERR